MTFLRIEALCPANGGSLPICLLTCLVFVSTACFQSGQGAGLGPANLALHKPTSQGPARHINYLSRKNPAVFASPKAVDGREVSDNKECTQTKSTEFITWWMVDLQAEYKISEVALLNRKTFGRRLKNFTVDIFLEDPRRTTGFPETLGRVCAHQDRAVRGSTWAELSCDSGSLIGRYVRVIKWGYGNLALCEVKVFGSMVKFGRTYDRIPNRSSQTEPQQHLGVFGSPILCGLAMVHDMELNAFQFNLHNGNCYAYTKGSEWNLTVDGQWDTFVDVI